MTRQKIHILYEYGVNMRPHASASLRLLRPFFYPAVGEQVEVTAGHDLGSHKADLVLVDRLWRPDIRPDMAYRLAEEVHKDDAKLIFWFDDNFLALDSQNERIENYKACFQAFLAVSDGLVVSSYALKEAFAGKQKTVFLPSALDERLVVQKIRAGEEKQKLVIGYMGTGTHDDDLRMVLPALQAVNSRYPGRLQFQFIGVLDHWESNNIKEDTGLAAKILRTLPGESEYQLFMPWFTGSVHWDIAIAPLAGSNFNGFKSDIKFLDYSAAGMAGIYSAMPAYQAVVEHRKTGLVVENDPAAWTAALEELIENAALRESIVRNADRYLYQQRILEKCAGNWLQALEESAS